MNAMNRPSTGYFGLTSTFHLLEGLSVSTDLFMFLSLSIAHPAAPGQANPRRPLHGSVLHVHAAEAGSSTSTSSVSSSSLIVGSDVTSRISSMSQILVEAPFQ